MSVKAAAIQRQEVQPTGHIVASANSVTYGDLPLSELSGEMRARIADFRFPSWIGSLDFCESYACPSFQSVAFCANPSGGIQEVIFFNERKRAGLFKELEVAGPVYAKSELLLQLRAKHQPDLMRLCLQSASTFPERIDDWTLAEVRRVSEDYRIDLPATCEEYLQRLGKQTRKHLPYYLRRLRRECRQSFAIETALGKQLSRQSFVNLLKLNRLRLHSKGQETLWTREIVEHRWPLIQKTGLFLGLQLDGKLAGGTLSILCGGEAFLIAIAHDPQYERWNLGNICLWQTVEHLIRLGCLTFHLLWGASFYKAQFGARLVPIYRITYARDLPAAAVCWLSSWLRIEEAASVPGKLARRLKRYVVPNQEYLSEE